MWAVISWKLVILRIFYFCSRQDIMQLRLSLNSLCSRDATQFLILFPLPPECWGYRFLLPCAAWKSFCFQINFIISLCVICMGICRSPKDPLELELWAILYGCWDLNLTLWKSIKCSQLTLEHFCCCCWLFVICIIFWEKCVLLILQ